GVGEWGRGGGPEPPPGPPPVPPRTGPTGPREQGSTAYAYEVQYLLDADDEAVARLRRRLGQLGDSLVVVGGGDRPWNVHVHVNDVGAAVEAGVEAGRPYRITVTRFDEPPAHPAGEAAGRDRKSTRLNSSHVKISYAVFCLKKKKTENT